MITILVVRLEKEKSNASNEVSRIPAPALGLGCV